MNLSGNRKAALKKLKNLFFSLKSDVKSFRAKFDSVFTNSLLPNNVECSERSYAGVNCDLFLPEIYITKRIILHIHGGCFVGGSKQAYRNFAASLAARVLLALSNIFLISFSLAASHV